MKIPFRSMATLAAAIVCLPPAVLADASDAQLQEILVTAQKREQNFNDVGVAVSVLTSDEIAATGVKSLVDVMSVTPNLQMKNVLANSITNVTIRGIGLNDYAVNNNPAAGIYVDNVYLVSPAMLTFGLFDVERIEVLRGPQGDLYGRNTTAGAVNIISRKPSATTDVEAEAGVGNYENYHFNGAVGGALTSTLTGRLAVQTVQQESGWQTNYVTGDRVGKINRTAGRLELDWKPNDSFNVLLSAHAGYDRSDVDLIKVANVTTNLGSQYADQPYVSGASNKPHMNLESAGGSVTIDWSIARDLTLTSISAYEHFTRLHVEDRDGTALRQLDGTFDNHIDQFSQELRLTYVRDTLAWIAGAFYSQDVVKTTDTYDAPDLLDLLGLAGLDTIGNSYRQHTETYAGFLHGEWTFAPQWTLVGGVRFTDEHKKFDQATTFLGAGGVTSDVFPPVTNHFSTTNTSGKIGINYKPAAETLIYASVSRGFKSGGFQGQLTFDPTALKPFSDENLTAYELGIKSRLVQNTLQINGAIFDYEYHDMQFYGPLFNSPVGVLFGITNVGDARVKGAEADAWWRPLAGMDVRFGVGTINTKITKSVVDGVTTGSQLPNAPELTLNGMVRYQWALNDRLGADFTVSGHYQSNLAFDIVRNPPEALAGGYFLLNAEAGVSPGDHWRVWIWGQNLCDRLYKTQAIYSSVGWGYSYGAPRTYGINLSYKL